jgi:hypothetical protein
MPRKVAASIPRRQRLVKSASGWIGYSGSVRWAPEHSALRWVALTNQAFLRVDGAGERRGGADEKSDRSLVPGRERGFARAAI